MEISEYERSDIRLADYVRANTGSDDTDWYLNSIVHDGLYDKQTLSILEDNLKMPDLLSELGIVHRLSYHIFKLVANTFSKKHRRINKELPEFLIKIFKDYEKNRSTEFDGYTNYHAIQIPKDTVLRRDKNGKLELPSYFYISPFDINENTVSLLKNYGDLFRLDLSDRSDDSPYESRLIIKCIKDVIDRY
jgi:hypothetical protein